MYKTILYYIFFKISCIKQLYFFLKYNTLWKNLPLFLPQSIIFFKKKNQKEKMEDSSLLF